MFCVICIFDYYLYLQHYKIEISTKKEIILMIKQAMSKFKMETFYY